MAPQAPDETVRLFQTAKVLKDELDYLRPGLPAGAQPNLAALCLSGGGIRSAAFSLGVIQALASRKLLRRFDYVSTVSGGGFIGAWLQSLLKHYRPPQDAPGTAMDAFERELGGGKLAALQSLRNYTNYLTPDTSLYSADVWAGFSLFLRNLVLTWLIILPLALVVGLVLVAYRTFLAFLIAHSPLHDSFAAFVGISILTVPAMAYAIYHACTGVPSHRIASNPALSTDRLSIDYVTTGRIWRRIIYPTLAWSVLLPIFLSLAFATWTDKTLEAAGLLQPHLLVLSLMYFAALLLGYWMARCSSSSVSDQEKHLYRTNALTWVIASAIAAILIYAFLFLFSTTFYKDLDRPLVMLIVLPPLAILIHMTQNIIFVGWRRDSRLAELDKEWLARVNGILIRTAVIWLTLTWSCLFVSGLISRSLGFTDDGSTATTPTIFAGASALLTGPIAAWVGKQVANGPPRGNEGSVSATLRRLALPLLSFLFLVSALSLVNAALEYAVGRVQEPFLAGLAGGGVLEVRLPDGEIKQIPTGQAYGVMLSVQLAFGAVIAIVIWCTSRLSVNKFSMHNLYKNRLMRAFIGTTRPTRNPDTFTGFDQDDNVKLSSLRDGIAGNKLFPIVNITLNLTRPPIAAWEERKAASFVATPFVCGSASLRKVSGTAAPSDGVYVDTKHFGGGDTSANQFDQGASLGTVMTISGAAMSPNWGYHTSALVAFVMTMFNMRLGAWLPNPARVSRREDIARSSPRNAAKAILNELWGRTTDKSDAIYLSDGGHFDNLGLYEIFRRRCSTIVVVDAGQDENCELFDLGNAIRKAEIDLSVRVRFRRMSLAARNDVRAARDVDNLGFAVATIEYADKSRGRLLYVKPAFMPGLSTPILAYANSSPSFPHEGTHEQWFSESQFESYRALGEAQLMGVLPDGQSENTLEELMAGAFEAIKA